MLNCSQNRPCILLNLNLITLKRLLIILLLLTSTYFYAQTKSKCSDVKTGVFKVDETIIKRTENIQFETNAEKHFKASYTVVWLDDCTYELRDKKFISGPEYLKGHKGDVLTVKILWVKDKTMKVALSSNFADFKINLEMEIIK
jgi:hypothetical protein